MLTLNGRLDLVEKLTDVSTSIKQMLKKCTKKNLRQEQIDEIIFEKLKERAARLIMFTRIIKESTSEKVMLKIGN